MRAYIIRRLLLVIPTLLILSLIVFFSVRLIPGDTIDAMLGSQDFGAEGDREALERMLGLDVPAHVQYVRCWAIFSCTAASVIHSWATGTR